MIDRNETLFNHARAVIPGNVGSPVRASGSVSGVPRFIKRAQDTYVWDENGTRYADHIGSWGPAIVGHAHPEVIEAVREAALDGLSFSMPIRAEIVIAEKIAKLVSSVEQLRLVSSGIEATMSAIRLAYDFTGRDKIIKFGSCYHGHSDSPLVKAGSGLLTFGNPSSAGVPADFTKHTLVLEYSNIVQLEETFEKIGGEIACVITEPFADDVNLARLLENFVRALHSLSAKHSAMLIYDKVITGFRVILDDAQSLHGITPDLITMSKVIGGGMPLAAFGGRKDIMAYISPLGGVYQTDTLSGNPVAVTAGLKALEIIRRKSFYENLTTCTEQLVKNSRTTAAKVDVAFTVDSMGGVFGPYFADHVPQNYDNMTRSNTSDFKRFFHGMLEYGVAPGPSAYEADLVSAAYIPGLIDKTAVTAGTVFAGVAG